MSNSIRQHFQRIRAAKAVSKANQDPRLSARNRPIGQTMVNQSIPVADATGETTPPTAGASPSATNNFELKFFNDESRLSGIQSISTKTELKAEILPSYLPWIEGTIAEGRGPQNDMLVKLMVWALDIHDFDTAINIAEYALLNDFAMPEPFTRDVATVFVEQLSDELLKNTDDVANYVDTIIRAVELTTDQDMPDQVRAKLYRVLGDSLKDNKPTDAIDAYKKAIKLDEKVGCKKDLAALDKPSE